MRSSGPASKATKQEVTSIVVEGCSTEKYVPMFQSKDNEGKKDRKDDIVETGFVQKKTAYI